MATVKAVDLINRAEEILQDTTNVRWSQQTLLNYLNDAQREIVLFRPDANPVNAAFTMAANSAKQTLPSAALRLLSIYKNAAARVTKYSELNALVNLIHATILVKVTNGNVKTNQVASLCIRTENT